MVYVSERYVLTLVRGFKLVQNYQVGLPLNTHKSVKSSIQTTFDGKIRKYVKFCVRIDELVLKKNDFGRFYSSFRSYLFGCITRTIKEKILNGDFQSLLLFTPSS